MLVGRDWFCPTNRYLCDMEPENSVTPPARTDDIIACWLSGQIPEAEMIARLREDDLLRRCLEHRLGRRLAV